MNPYHDHSDTELLNLLNTGSTAAFEAIYRRYVGELYRYARRNIDVKEDCEEIVQEIFVSLWARRENLQVASLQHYLLRSVRYAIIRYFQRDTVRRRYAEHFRLFEAAYESAGETERTGEMLRERILQCMKALPERCQQALNLRLTENLSNSEIAQRMNIDKRTVEVYMFKAFNHLRASRKEIYKAG